MYFLEFAQSPDYDFFNIFYDLFLVKKNNLPVDSDLDVVGGLSN
jgi:hypothetical protein